MKYLLSFILFLISMHLSAQTGNIIGKVIDQESKDLLLYASVALYQDGILIVGSQTNFDGRFEITGLEIGKYDIEVKYIGYKTEIVKNILVKASKDAEVNIQMKAQGVVISCFTYNVDYIIPIHNNFEMRPSGRIIRDEVLEKFPSKDINTMLRTVY